jgi:NAD(P)-dependent dehydrogenase (short-subunit alcohol dehydrogenase family)
VIAAPPAARNAVVTGGGRGIGAAVARALAAAGAQVMVARTVTRSSRWRGHPRHRGEAWALPATSRTRRRPRPGTAARERLGGVDVLVNNAGAQSSSPLVKITLDEWNRVLGVIATGTFLCTREFLPGMIERGFGRIVNVASVAGLDGAKYIAHYSAAKHAVIGLTRTAALEVGGTGVTVNAVCPAYVDTALTERTVANVQARTGMAHDAALRAVLGSIGQQRLVTPAEVAHAVLAFCRDVAGEHNGQVIALDGESARP